MTVDRLADAARAAGYALAGEPQDQADRDRAVAPLALARDKEVALRPTDAWWREWLAVKLPKVTA